MNERMFTPQEIHWQVSPSAVRLSKAREMSAVAAARHTFAHAAVFTSEGHATGILYWQYCTVLAVQYCTGSTVLLTAQRLSQPQQPTYKSARCTYSNVIHSIANTTRT
jgi:hypothetical protein